MSASNAQRILETLNRPGKLAYYAVIDKSPGKRRGWYFRNRGDKVFLFLGASVEEVLCRLGRYGVVCATGCKTPEPEPAPPIPVPKAGSPLHLQYQQEQLHLRMPQRIELAERPEPNPISKTAPALTVVGQSDALVGERSEYGRITRFSLNGHDAFAMESKAAGRGDQMILLIAARAEDFTVFAQLLSNLAAGRELFKGPHFSLKAAAELWATATHDPEDMELAKPEWTQALEKFAAQSAEFGRNRSWAFGRRYNDAREHLHDLAAQLFKPRVHRLGPQLESARFRPPMGLSAGDPPPVPKASRPQKSTLGRGLDKEAAAIFARICSGLAVGAAATLDRQPARFMALRVTHPAGEVYGLRHLYRDQAGADVQDLGMRFLLAGDGGIYPIDKEDGTIVETALTLGPAGAVLADAKASSKLAKFADKWLRNIADQQLSQPDADGAATLTAGAEIAAAMVDAVQNGDPFQVLIAPRDGDVRSIAVIPDAGGYQLLDLASGKGDLYTPPGEQPLSPSEEVGYLKTVLQDSFLTSGPAELVAVQTYAPGEPLPNGAVTAGDGEKHPTNGSRRTPGTRLVWSNLAEWLGALDLLEKRHGRHPSAATYAAQAAHWQALASSEILDSSEIGRAGVAELAELRARIPKLPKGLHANDPQRSRRVALLDLIERRRQQLERLGARAGGDGAAAAEGLPEAMHAQGAQPSPEDAAPFDDNPDEEEETGPAPATADGPLASAGEELQGGEEITIPLVEGVVEGGPVWQDRGTNWAAIVRPGAAGIVRDFLTALESTDRKAKKRFPAALFPVGGVVEFGSRKFSKEAGRKVGTYLYAVVQAVDSGGLHLRKFPDAQLAFEHARSIDAEVQSVEPEEELLAVESRILELETVAETAQRSGEKVKGTTAAALKFLRRRRRELEKLVPDRASVLPLDVNSASEGAGRAWAEKTFGGWPITQLRRERWLGILHARQQTKDKEAASFWGGVESYLLGLPIGEVPPIGVQGELAAGLRPDSRKTRAAKLRQLSANVAAQIAAKRNSGLYRLNPTRRRAGMLESIEQSAEFLTLVQSKLEALASALDGDCQALGLSDADLVEDSCLPETLERVETRVLVEDLLRSKTYPVPWLTRQRIMEELLPAIALIPEQQRADVRAVYARCASRGEGYQPMCPPQTLAEIEALGHLAERAQERSLRQSGLSAYERRSREQFAQRIKRDLGPLRRVLLAGWTGQAEYTSAREALLALGKPPEYMTPKEKALLKLRRSLIGARIPGYFPTTDELSRRLVAESGLKPGDRGLEPQGGSGHIARHMRAAGVEPDVYEINTHLAEILRLQDFNVLGADFLAAEAPKDLYDVIIMNPPFDADAEHVQHAFHFVKPGGRIVAIMGESIFKRGPERNERFADWLKELGSEGVQLPPGSFASSDVSTYANSRLVVIDKPKASNADKKRAFRAPRETHQSRDYAIALLLGSGERVTLAVQEKGGETEVELPGGGTAVLAGDGFTPASLLGLLKREKYIAATALEASNAQTPTQRPEPIREANVQQGAETPKSSRGSQAWSDSIETSAYLNRRNQLERATSSLLFGEKAYRVKLQATLPLSHETSEALFARTLSDAAERARVAVAEAELSGWSVTGLRVYFDRTDVLLAVADNRGLMLHPAKDGGGGFTLEEESRADERGPFSLVVEYEPRREGGQPQSLAEVDTTVDSIQAAQTLVRAYVTEKGLSPDSIGQGIIVRTGRSPKALGAAVALDWEGRVWELSNRRPTGTEVPEWLLIADARPGAYSAAFSYRRLSQRAAERQAILRELERAENKGPPALQLERQTRLDRAEAAIQFWQIQLEAAGGIKYGSELVPMGGYVKALGQWFRVLRSNGKSATVGNWLLSDKSVHSIDWHQVRAAADSLMRQVGPEKLTAADQKALAALAERIRIDATPYNLNPEKVPAVLRQELGREDLGKMPPLARIERALNRAVPRETRGLSMLLSLIRRAGDAAEGSLRKALESATAEHFIKALSELAEAGQDSRAAQEMRLYRALGLSSTAEGSSGSESAQTELRGSIAPLPLAPQPEPQPPATGTNFMCPPDSPGCDLGPMGAQCGISVPILLRDATGGLKRIQARYCVTDIRRIIPSHATPAAVARTERGEAYGIKASRPVVPFAARPDYPDGVQERRYDRPEEQIKISQIAQAFAPEEVWSPSSNALSGPPIVTPNGWALGGNGRTMGVDEFYNDAAPEVRAVRIAEAKAYLRSMAGVFGLLEADIDSVEEPTIVRVVNTKSSEAGKGASDLTAEDRLELVDLVRRFNVQLGQRMDALSEATAQARLLPISAIAQLADNIGDDTLAEFLDSKGSAGFVQLLTRSVISPNDPVLLQGAGLSSAGKEYVERMLTASLVPDTGFLEKLGPSLRKSVAQMAPYLVAAGSAGGDWDLRPSLNAALREYIAFKGGETTNPDRYLDEPRMFRIDGTAAKPGETARKNLEETPAGVSLFLLLAAHAGSYRSMSKFARGFARDAAEQSAPQSGLFAVVPRTPAEALRINTPN